MVCSYRLAAELNMLSSSGRALRLKPRYAGSRLPNNAGRYSLNVIDWIVPITILRAHS